MTEWSLKCARIQSTEWSLSMVKCDWKPPFPSPFSCLSATIQSPFSRLKGEILSCVYSLGKGMPNSMDKSRMLFSLQCFMLSLVEIKQVVPKKRIFKVVNVISVCRYFCRHWTNFNPLHSRSLVESGRVLLEKKVFESRLRIVTMSLLSYLEKRVILPFPHTQVCFVPSLVEVVRMVLEKMIM